MNVFVVFLALSLLFDGGELLTLLDDDVGGDDDALLEVDTLAATVVVVVVVVVVSSVEGVARVDVFDLKMSRRRCGATSAPAVAAAAALLVVAFIPASSDAHADSEEVLMLSDELRFNASGNSLPLFTDVAAGCVPLAATRRRSIRMLL